MGKVKIKIKFSKDLDKDARNWWEANNRLSYGYDFGKKCPLEIKKKVKGKKWKDVKNYLKNTIKKYYKEYPDWKRINEKNIKPYWGQIIKRLEKIHNRKFPVKAVTIFYTSSPRCPYGGGSKNFWIQIHTHKKNKKALLEILVHELMHLFFHKYFWQVCKKSELNEEQIHDIKESFSVLINEEFKDLKLQDRGYDSHKKLRRFILKEWKKSKNFEKVLKSTIKYHQQKCR